MTTTKKKDTEQNSKNVSERYVIGTILNNPETITNVTLNHLITDEAKRVLASILLLIRNNKEITIASVAEQSNMEVDVIAMLFEYNDLNNLETYLKDLQRKKHKTHLLEIKSQIATATSLLEVERLIEVAKRNNLPLPSKGNLLKLIDESLIEYHKRKDSPDAIIPFPLKELNVMIGGLFPEMTFYLAGRPGQGKSAFSSQVREKALKNNKKVVTFSLDMAKKRLINRAASRNLHIDVKKITAGNLTEKEEEEYTLFLGKLAILEDRWFVYDVTDFGRKDILQEMYDILATIDPDLYEVDYAQKIYLNTTMNRVQELSYISRELSLFSVMFSCVGFIQAQLNREVESRQNKRPQLSDLRDSGGLEQEADVVLMIYREHYYDPSYYDPTEAEFLVTKNRLGETGKIFASWIGERFMFEDKFV